MSNTKVTEGKTIRYAHSAAVISGQPVKIGLMLGVAMAAAAINTEADYAITEVHEITKVTADVVAIGVQLYWDDTAKKLTTTAASNIKAGIAWAAASGTDTTVKVLLNKAGG